MTSRKAGSKGGVTKLRMMERRRSESKKLPEDAEGAGDVHAMLMKVLPCGRAIIRNMG